MKAVGTGVISDVFRIRESQSTGSGRCRQNRVGLRRAGDVNPLMFIVRTRRIRTHTSPARLTKFLDPRPSAFAECIFKRTLNSKQWARWQAEHSIREYMAGSAVFVEDSGVAAVARQSKLSNFAVKSHFSRDAGISYQIVRNNNSSSNLT